MPSAYTARWLQTAGTGDQHPDGPKPSHTLIIKTDHSIGAGQRCLNTLTFVQLDFGQQRIVRYEQRQHAKKEHHAN